MSPSEDWRIRVFDSLSFPTLILDTEHRIVAANRKFLERKHIPEEMQIVGKTCRDIFRNGHDPDLPCLRNDCPLAQTITQKTGHSLLRQIRQEDGRTRWEDRVFSPILDDRGEVSFVIESIRDVTKTKQLEIMFQGISEFMDRVIQSSPSPIVAADRKGQVLLMNRAAENLFGYRVEDVPELNIEALYPVGVAREIMKKLRDDSFGGHGKMPMTRVDIRTSSGELIPVEMTAAIIYEGDEEVATMGIYNDLRERLSIRRKLMEAQAQVVQSEKMASLGRLAAGVAHEINNPLTGILMFTGMALEKLPPGSSLRKTLHCILEDAERCRDIVKNLLVYSRQTSTRKEVFALNDLVEEGLRLIRDQKLLMHIDIHKDLCRDSIQVFADANKLKQVMINLIMNAIDAMAGRGTLTLRTYRNEQRDSGCIEVQDTGSGIAKEHLPRIFDPFYTTKAPGKGTGLGLSTAIGIVKDNNGSLTVKETGPNGTTFLLELPLVHAAENGFPDSIG